MARECVGRAKGEQIVEVIRTYLAVKLLRLVRKIMPMPERLILDNALEFWLIESRKQMGYQE